MENYIICKICDEKCTRIYGAHLKKHGITSKEYKEKYPGEPLTTISDKYNVSKNSGKHMKEEKYKKMFSEMYLGEKNPNHKSNTTEEQRKSRSPFSKEFINYKDIEDKESVIKNFISKINETRPNNTKISYWIDKGYNEDDARSMVSNRQKTFSLEKCIEKLGDEKGTERWSKRQKIWQQSLMENGNMKCGYSQISQELFYDIMKFYTKDLNLKNVYFATKNKEYYISKMDIGFFVYDFTDLNSMKIIEFNGDIYHANPSKYKESDYIHPFYKENGPSAKEMWDRDKIKIDVAKERGFDVMTIWESDYKKNPEITVNQCLNFLNLK